MSTSARGDSGPLTWLNRVAAASFDSTATEYALPDSTGVIWAYRDYAGRDRMLVYLDPARAMAIRLPDARFELYRDQTLLWSFYGHEYAPMYAPGDSLDWIYSRFDADSLAWDPTWIGTLQDNENCFEATAREVQR